MRLCPQCGHQNDDDSEFCVVDGAKLGDSSRIVVSLEEPEETATQWVPKPPAGPGTAANRPQPANYGLLYALIGGLVVAVVLLGLYVLMTARGENPSESNKVTNTAASNNAVVASNIPSPGATKAGLPNPSGAPPPANSVVDKRGKSPEGNKAVVASKTGDILRRGYNGRVIMLNAYVRLLPTDYSPYVQIVSFNEPIKIGRSAGGNSPWYRITTASGQTGWMHGNTIEFVR